MSERNSYIDDDICRCFIAFVFAVVYIIVVSGYSNGMSVSYCQLGKLVDESKAAADNGFRSSFLVYFTDTYRSFCCCDLVFQSFIQMFCCNCTCCIVVSSDGCVYGAFRSIGNACVKAYNRNTCFFCCLQSFQNSIL